MGFPLGSPKTPNVQATILLCVGKICGSKALWYGIVNSNVVMYGMVYLHEDMRKSRVNGIGLPLPIIIFPCRSAGVYKCYKMLDTGHRRIFCQSAEQLFRRHRRGCGSRSAAAGLGTSEHQIAAIIGISGNTSLGINKHETLSRAAPGVRWVTRRGMPLETLLEIFRTF